MVWSWLCDIYWKSHVQKIFTFDDSCILSFSPNQKYFIKIYFQKRMKWKILLPNFVYGKYLSIKAKINFYRICFHAYLHTVGMCLTEQGIYIYYPRYWNFKKYYLIHENATYMIHLNKYISAHANDFRFQRRFFFSISILDLESIHPKSHPLCHKPFPLVVLLLDPHYHRRPLTIYGTVLMHALIMGKTKKYYFSEMKYLFLV